MSWESKHRPERFDSIVGQPTAEIEALLDGQWTPNFMFHGPPATGKTTTARAMAREMFGSLESMYEINASDERGVDTIRNKIKKWARQDTGTQMTLGMNVPLILLDEMDGLTVDAQQALRSPMEDSKAVFVLTANSTENIHDAILSRCEVYHFTPPGASEIQDRLEEVARIEDADVDPQLIQDIAIECNGDVRNALRALERKVKVAESRQSDRADKVSDFIGGE